MKKEKIKNIMLVMLVGVISSTLTSLVMNNNLSGNKILGSVSHSDYLDSSKVTYLNSNVQDSIDNLYTQANDYSSINNRVNTLEGYFKNNPTSYFDGDNLVIRKNEDSSSIVLQDGTNYNSILLTDSENKIRTSLYYGKNNGFSVLDARDSSENSGTGVLSLLGNPVMINGRELAVHGCYSYSGTIASDGYLTVTHNLNITTAYYPVVSIGMNNTHALTVYNVTHVGSNSFKVGIACIDSYNLKAAEGFNVEVYWCY